MPWPDWYGSKALKRAAEFGDEISAKASSTVKDLAAKGRTISDTQPARPAGIDIRAMAESDAARARADKKKRMGVGELMQAK